ncbi:MAG: hypothetical protein R3C40_03165 [Parvularculaceae bacterium]
MIVERNAVKVVARLCDIGANRRADFYLAAQEFRRHAFARAIFVASP